MVVRPLVAIVIAIAACSTDAVPAIDDPAEFLAQVRAAECDTMVRCRIFGSADHCETVRHHRLGLPADIVVVPDVDWLAEQADGNAVYSPVDAAACLAAWRDRSCRSTAARDRCATAFRGIAIAGAVTRSPASCAAGFWENADCSGNCCRGSCGRQQAIPPRPEGTACGLVDGSGRRCDLHLSCRFGRCVRLTVGDACSQSNDCPEGLVCDGRCRPRVATGGPCTSSGDCGDLGSYCGFDQRCHLLPLDGERCDEGLCAPGLGCHPSGVCAGFLGEGDLCAELGLALCNRGLYCDQSAATCRGQRPDGADCVDDVECTGGVCGVGFRCGDSCR
jgi:hypothetical protein